MKVTVTQTVKASPDGLRTHTYESGHTYDMQAHLAEIFLREGWGKEAKKGAGPSQNKSADGSSETKADASDAAKNGGE